MNARVLTVTADPDFGKSLQFTLEVEGGWPTKLVSSLEDARADAAQAPFPVVVLDAGQFNGTLRQQVQDLQTALPQAAVVVILPEDLPDLPGLFGLGIDDYLIRPFYPKDLLSAVRDALAESQPGREPGSPPASSGDSHSSPEVAVPVSEPQVRPLQPEEPSLIDRFQPSGQAAQWLAEALQGLPVASAMIFGHGQLWHALHALPEKSQAEVVARVAQLVAATPEAQPGAVRFARFVVNEQTLALYGVFLEPELLMGFVFPEVIPFSRLRQVAAKAVARLRQASAPVKDGQDSQAGLQNGAVLTARKGASQDWEADELQVAPAFLLEDVPPPTPEELLSTLPEAKPVVWPWEAELESESGPAGDEAMETPADRSDWKAPESGSGISPGGTAWLPEHFDKPSSEPAGLAGGQSEGPEPHAGNRRQDGEAETPWPNAEMAERVNVIFDLSFACVLMPRLPAHHLTGAISRRLEKWMPQLALAFGWRLAHLSLADHALQWVAEVNPETSASQVVNLVRRHTSQRIFAEFPHLGLENPSGDYWAPGYLVRSAFKPLPDETVREYVTAVRQRQGASGQGLPTDT